MSTPGNGASIGKQKEFLDAWLAIEKHLIHDPLRFGECRYHMLDRELECRIGVVLPVAVEYGIHQAKQVVILRRVNLLGS